MWINLCRVHAKGRVLVGTQDGDTLEGGAGNDKILGLGGSDFLFGEAGNDTLKGGAGRDDLNGWTGNDLLYGGKDGDDLRGGEGNDTVYGDQGNDQFWMDTAADGFDRLYGGDGRDTLRFNHASGGSSANLATGIAITPTGEGRLSSIENLIGSQGDDTLIGNWRANIILGARGDDSIVGGGGSDTLSGTLGDDTLTGGSGGDAFVWQMQEDFNRVTDFQTGADKLVLMQTEGTALDIPLGDFVRNAPRFHAAPGATSAHDDSDRVIYDTLTGNVYLDNDGIGGTPATLIFVLQGAPALTATDISVRSESFLRDLFASAGEKLTGDACPNLLVGGSDNDTLKGLGGNDTLDGGPGNDLLKGGAGNDSLDGGLGSDTLYGGSGDDYLFGGGNSLDLPPGFSEGGDRLEGGDGNDTLDGRNSAHFVAPNDPDVDTLSGGHGNDMFFVDNPLDVLSDAGGIDTVIAVEVDWTLGAGFENLVMQTDISEHGTGIGNALDNRMSATWIARLEGRDGNDTLIGSSADDVLLGGAGNDRLEGRGGNDMLDGGPGNDVLIGDAFDDDVFLFSQPAGAANADRIADFAGGQDRLHFDGSVFAALGAPGQWGEDDPRFFAAAGASAGHDADDRLVYDTCAGKLYYDPDGSGAATAQIVACFQAAPALAASDITVV